MYSRNLFLALGSIARVTLIATLWPLSVNAQESKVAALVQTMEQQFSLINSGKGWVELRMELVDQDHPFELRDIERAYVVFQGEKMRFDGRITTYEDGSASMSTYYRDVFDGEKWILTSGSDSLEILEAAFLNQPPTGRALRLHPKRWTGLLNAESSGVAAMLGMGVQNGSAKVIGQEYMDGESCIKMSMRWDSGNRHMPLMAWLSEKKSYLPRHILLELTSGSLVDVKFSYRKVGMGIWLLDKGISTVTRKDGTLIIRHTYLLSDDFAVNNGPYPASLFEPTFPPGTRVFDARTRTQFISK